MSSNPSAVRRKAVLLFMAVALVAAACSSSSDSGSSDTSAQDTTTTVDTAALFGPENAATGDPVSIGYVYDGTTDVIDNQGELDAAQAAVEYANAYLGGVGGRPIELDVCSTDQTPSGASDCATQMIADDVLAVLNGVSGEGADGFAPEAEAGIPVFIANTIDQTLLGADHVSVMNNGILSALAGPAQVAADAGATQAAVIVTDVPAASGPVSQAAPIFYGNANVGVDVVPIPPDAPDMTPQVQAELSNDPGQFAMVGDPPFCTKAMNALESVGFTGQIVLIPQCLDENTAEAVNNLEGAIVLRSSTTDPASDEYQLYLAVLDTYGNNIDPGGVATDGYQAVLGFVTATAGLTGDVTAESIDAAILAMPESPVPLGGGITFQCNHEQVDIAPASCSTATLQATLDADGNATDYQVLEGADLLVLN